MLLSDTFHLLGFHIFDRKAVLEQKKRDKKRKILGGPLKEPNSAGLGQKSGLNFEPGLMLKEPQFSQGATDSSKSTAYTVDRTKTRSPTSPLKEAQTLDDEKITSPAKFKVHNKLANTSFLQGFDYLTEEDLDILASYEEE